MSSSICKLQNCECGSIEPSLDLLYWLSHRNIDIRPLFKQAYKKQSIDKNDESKQEANFQPSDLDNIQIEDLLRWNVPSNQESNVENDNTKRKIQHQGSHCKKLKK